jgi:sugar lactone lactonase YvrE
MSALRAEPVTGPVAFHGEGPVWWPGWGGLRWVDMLAGDVLSLRADGSIGRIDVGEIAAALRPRRAGGAVIGVRRGFALEEPHGTVRALPELWSGDEVRMNEGSCDPDGRFWCGSMAYDERPGGGALYRLDPDGATTRVLDGVTISNGLEWTADGTRAYYVDTPTQEISIFAYDAEAGLHDRRRFAAVDGAQPDGLTVDVEGGVWVALYDGHAVRRYGPSGTLDAEVPVPAGRVTACTFGGEGLDRLFITTSREGLGSDAPPAAGAVHAADVGVRGLPARTFAG